MGFNRRKMEDQRRQVAEKEAATRRATDAQVLEDAERLIAAWNECQAIGAPMIFSPTIGAAERVDKGQVTLAEYQLQLAELKPVPGRRSAQTKCAKNSGHFPPRLIFAECCHWARLADGMIV